MPKKPTYGEQQKRVAELEAQQQLLTKITDRKLAKESLHDNYRKFEEIFERSIVGKGEVDPATRRFIRANQALADMTGYSVAELCRMTFTDITHPDDRQRDLEIYEPVREGIKDTWQSEKRFLRKDGSVIWVSVAGNLIRYDDGKPSRTIAVVLDITERKRAEDKLRESQAKLESAFASMTEAIFIADAEGRLTDFNDEFIRYHRFKDKAECSKTIVECPTYLDAYFPDGMPAPVEMWAMPRALRGETGSNIEYMLRRKDTGETWWGSYSFGPIKDENGRIAGAVVAAREITDQKQAEEALQERERLLQTVIDGSTSPIFLKDLDGKFITINTALERMLGISREEIKGKTDYDIAPKKVADYWRTHDKQVMATRKATQIEEAADLQDGHHIFLANKFPLVDVDGQIYGVGTISHDITERKKAEEALQRLNETLEQRVAEGTAEVAKASVYNRSLIESSIDPLVTIGSDGRITDVNVATEAATGRARAELVGTDFSDYFTDPEKAREGYRRVFREGFVRDYPLKIRHHDGHVTPVLYNATVYRDEAGQVVGIFAAARDITERKRAEEALRRSEQEFRALAEAVPQIVWATRPDGWNIYFNQKWVDYTGLTPEESYGHGWNTPFHPDDRQRAWEAWKHATQDGAPYSLECRLRRADGIYRWWLIRGEPMRSANGEILKWFGTCTDIEDLKQASEQLRRITSELMFAEQRERQRLAQTLHDGLQQILVGAKYRLALLGRGGEIRQATSQIEDLIDDAIETSRSLSVELSPPILLQGDFVSALEWLARWMHDKHGIEVSLKARTKIGYLKKDVIFLLFQAARELLFNVVKHARVKNAYIELNQLDGRVSMTVEDKGVGFDQNVLAFRGGQSSGTGLFGINERLSHVGGKIEIDSRPGFGSRFRLIVPIVDTNAEAEQGAIDENAKVSVAISAQLDSKTPGVEKKIRIALIDDHIVVRQGLAGLLRSEPDFEIAGEASDGQSAIDLIRELRPDVVLMDIGMPGIDGIQVTRIIHKELPQIRIIGLSMFAKGEQEKDIREAGAVDYLTKSGSSDTLIQTIRACMK